MLILLPLLLILLFVAIAIVVIATFISAVVVIAVTHPGTPALSLHVSLFCRGDVCKLPHMSDYSLLLFLHG